LSPLRSGSAELRIALLQMAASGDPTVKGERFCRDAQEGGADIALFPEMWNIGYDLPECDAGRAELPGRAVSTDAPFVQHFVSLARELEMAIGVTYLEAWEPAPRNTFSLIDRHGEIRLTYAKVHTCDFEQEAALTPGDGFRVASLDTAAGPVEIGAMICFDREFPESARMLMLLGAEVVLVPNSCPMDDIRWTLLKARAFENMFVVALANYTDDADANGGSAAFHPMAWDGPDGPPVDTTIVRAGTEEGVIFADVDLEALRAWRARETQGDAYRKPRAYGALTADGVRDPFRRPDARR